MRRILQQSFVLGFGVAALVSVSSIAEAQPRATVVLKSGAQHAGVNLNFRIDRPNLTIREDAGSQPSIPVNQVAYVDFGSAPDPGNLGLNGSQQAVVLRDGAVLRGELIEMAHGDTNNTSTPYLVIIKTDSGERRLEVNQVARVYFPAGQAAVSTATSSGSAVARPAGEFVRLTIPASQAWTNTGIRVRRNQQLAFSTSGEVLIGGGLPANTVVGAAHTSNDNTLPSAPTGALIARIGNGRPFVIGNQATIVVTEAGNLQLGVNDSHYGDNSGAFVVEVAPRATPGR